MQNTTSMSVSMCVQCFPHGCFMFFGLFFGTLSGRQEAHVPVLGLTFSNMSLVKRMHSVAAVQAGVSISMSSLVFQHCLFQML